MMKITNTQTYNSNKQCKQNIAYKSANQKLRITQFSPSFSSNGDINYGLMAAKVKLFLCGSSVDDLHKSKDERALYARTNASVQRETLDTLLSLKDEKGNNLFDCDYLNSIAISNKDFRIKLAKISRLKMPIDEWKKVRKYDLLVHNKTRTNQLTDFDISHLACLGKKNLDKIKERKLLDKYPGRKSDFEGPEIRALEKLSDKEWQNVIKRNLLPTNKDAKRDFHVGEILAYATLEDKDWKKLKERNLLVQSDDSALLDTHERVELAKCNEKTWKKIQERNLLKKMFFRHLYGDEIMRLANLDDNSWKNTKGLLFFENRGSQFHINDILRIGEKTPNLGPFYEKLATAQQDSGRDLSYREIKALTEFSPEKLPETFEMKLELNKTAKLAKANITAEEEKEFGLNLDQIIKETEHVIKHSATPTKVSRDAIFDFLKNFLSNSPEVEKTIKTADFDRFGTEGIPLKYPREKFIQDVNNVLAPLDKKQKAFLYTKMEIAPKFDDNGQFWAYDGILTSENLDKNDKTQMVLSDLINKFTLENSVELKDKKLEKSLNSLIKGVPEFTNIIGKKQHETHQLSVDIHTLKVLQEALNNPLYNKLENEDKLAIKLSILFHDFGKSEGIIDKGHQNISALYTRNLLEKFTLPQNTKDRIFELVKNHHWLEEFNKNIASPEEIAVRFRKPNDYKIAQIMAESDLKGVNNGFFEQYGDALRAEKQEPIVKALSKLNQSGTMIVPTKILVSSKIPQVEYNGKKYKVLDFTRLSPDCNLESLGLWGAKTPDDLRLLVHMLPENGVVDAFCTAELLTDVANEGVLSISLLSLKNKVTYKNRPDGIVVNIENNNFATAYPENQFTATSKDFSHFIKLSAHNDKERSFLKDQVVSALEPTYGKISDEEYGRVYSFISKTKYLSQINNEVNFDTGKRLILGKDLKQAISMAQDELINRIPDKHNEIVAFDPKIAAIISKRNSLQDVPSKLLDIANDRNLPIILIGERMVV